MTRPEHHEKSVRKLQIEIDDHPYSTVHRLNLANKYAELKYPDLAAGEVYLALLLCDEVVDESGEYHEQANEAAAEDMKSAGIMDKVALDWINQNIETTVYTLLARSLFEAGCLKSALLYCTRGSKKHPEEPVLLNLRRDIETQVLRTAGKSDMKEIALDKISDKTKVRREMYEWNHHEPDRCSQETLDLLNSQLATVAPKLEVKIIDLPDLRSENSSQRLLQLGLFTKADIAPGELILNEKSLVTGTSRLMAEFCEACSISRGDGYQMAAYCPDCTDTTVFCTTECEELAQSSYHPAVCDTDALVVGKDPKIHDAADAMYAQLLLRVFAMSITQDVHPLDLPEIQYLCGNYVDPIDNGKPAAISLPFSFDYNIQMPIHFLEKMDINIFTTSSRYSTDSINTLYAKFRGVASAKQGSNGMPEVAAVHPLWCLANHSCDPNVRWEWNGSMRLWAREEMVGWQGKTEAARPGIKKGQEILSHYCDVRMPVRERREWASGALGGECRCERCVWEEKLEEVQNGQKDA